MNGRKRHRQITLIISSSHFTRLWKHNMRQSLRRTLSIAARAFGMISILIVGFTLGLTPQINQMKKVRTSQGHLGKSPSWMEFSEPYTLERLFNIAFKTKNRHAQLRNYQLQCPVNRALTVPAAVQYSSGGLFQEGPA